MSAALVSLDRGRGFRRQGNLHYQHKTQTREPGLKANVGKRAGNARAEDRKSDRRWLVPEIGSWRPKLGRGDSIRLTVGSMGGTRLRLRDGGASARPDLIQPPAC